MSVQYSVTGVSSEDAEKLRGGYYTPAPLAEWMCDWAIRSGSDRVLEPSCGDGVFLREAKTRVMQGELVGIEISPTEVVKCANGLKGFNAVVHCDDFFAWLRNVDQPAFDCCVGNPPFIRYQKFPEPSRSLGMELLQNAGLRPNKLTNIWVPFVVGATLALKPGGRLALVLPAELLQVSYAAQLRQFLTDQFATINIIACNHLFFNGAEQETILLLGDGKRIQSPSAPECEISLREVSGMEDILRLVPQQLSSEEHKRIDHGTEKWLKYFLSAKEIGFMRSLKSCSEVVPLSTHAEVDVGIVTGRNEFFVVSRNEVERFALENCVIKLVGRSSQLSGAVFRESEWNSMAEDGSRVFLFSVSPINGATLTNGVEDYIKDGEQRGVHRGYKCSIRSPWYAVPSIWAPDCFLFRQIYDFPRVVLNKAGAVSTDTIHRMRCLQSPAKVAAGLYTSLTAASAEIEGRSYGGGVLELEPTEAEAVLMPQKLTGSMTITEIDKRIRAGQLTEVLCEQDKRLLMGNVGLSRKDCNMLRAIWQKMRDRRRNRRR